MSLSTAYVPEPREINNNNFTSTVNFNLAQSWSEYHVHETRLTWFATSTTWTASSGSLGKGGQIYPLRLSTGAGAQDCEWTVILSWLFSCTHFDLNMWCRVSHIQNCINYMGCDGVRVLGVLLLVALLKMNRTLIKYIRLLKWGKIHFPTCFRTTKDDCNITRTARMLIRKREKFGKKPQNDVGSLYFTKVGVSLQSTIHSEPIMFHYKKQISSAYSSLNSTCQSFTKYESTYKDQDRFW